MRRQQERILFAVWLLLIAAVSFFVTEQAVARESVITEAVAYRGCQNTDSTYYYGRVRGDGSQPYVIHWKFVNWSGRILGEGTIGLRYGGTLHLGGFGSDQAVRITINEPGKPPLVDTWKQPLSCP